MAKIAQKHTNADRGTVTFEFADDLDSITADASKLPKPIQAQLIVHGLSQVLGDSYSGEKDPATARQIVQAKLDRLSQGEWRKPREGGSTGPRVSQLAEALSRVTGKELDACVEKVAGFSDDDKKALRKHPAIAQQLEAIKIERSQAKVKELEAAAASADKLDI